MEVLRESLVDSILDEGGDCSPSSYGISNLKRECTRGTMRFLVDLCEEKYWKYNCKPFIKANLESFANHLIEQFLEEAQRTW